MYKKIVHGKSGYIFSNHSYQRFPEIYTVRKFYEMSALSVNDFAIDVNPLVGF